MKGVFSSNSISNLLFDDAFSCDLKLICLGNKKLENKLMNAYLSKDKTITFCDKENEFVSKKMPGKTRTNINKSKILNNKGDYVDSINVYIYDDGSYMNDGMQKTLHTDAHEIFHIFSSIIPTIVKNNKNYYLANNSVYYNGMGTVGKFNNKGVNTYGIMFKETITDTLARLSLTRFNKSFDNSISSNDIIKKRDKDYTYDTCYSTYTLLSKLAVAAFSNDPYSDFDEMISENKNIFFGRRTSPNGEKIFKNDLLYGYLANPLHIKEKWEEINGIDSYDSFCEDIDNSFNQYLSNGIIDKNSIERYVNSLTTFLNNKLTHYMNIGRLSYEDASLIADNYNSIWLDVNKEISQINDNKNTYNMFNNKNNYNLFNPRKREYI